ncbi:glycosyl hydrolase 108 family protein [Psychrobacter sp. AOP42-A1-21]|uniref:glycosyl hydrolase 108 family protein n=1 Tax=Psychrobacter sp. AOP42-A1-21 TaxID=3457675 RepID=UPI00403556F2
MSNSQKKLTAWFVLFDAQSKVLKNIEYKVTAVNSNEEEEHVVKGKTNSKGATYEFVKPIHTKLCLYVKIGTKDFKKAGNISLPPVKENRLKIKAKISAVLIDSKLKKHGNEAGSIKRKDYKVVTGDTLESIAKKHNTDIATLKRLNPKIKSIHKIFAGHWLKVPVQIGDVGKETEDKPSPSVSTKPPATKTKGSEPVDSEQPWYDKAWDSVKDIHDEADAMIDRAEEAIKDGQQKIIKGTLEAMESVTDASEKLYDTLFGDKEDTTPSNTNPTQNKGKVDEPKLDVKKETGNNQKGNPVEQITYDSDTTVYHIYFDGRIERQHPKAEKYAAFVYYDEGGSKHYLGKTKYIKTPRYGGGKDVYLVNIGGDSESSKYDGSQIDDNNISSVEKEKRLSKYRKGKVSYNIFMNSKEYQRYYLSGVAMATFLGALCKLGYDDISFNGASKIDGSPGPSSSHTNGKCIDIRYLRKDKKALEMILDDHNYDSQYDHERNIRLVNTMHEFGWGKRKRPDNSIVKMLSVYFTNPKAGINKSYILPHCGPYRGHDNHLHLQGLVADIKDIDVIHKEPENENVQPTDDCTKKFHRVSKIILRHEGGYVDDPTDKGGKTNMGIAWKTWLTYAKSDLGLEPTKNNLKNITSEQAEIIYRKRYWEPKGFCKVENDKVGLMIYDWSITSGGAGKEVQKLLTNEFKQDVGIIDGAIGSKTIQAVNNVENQKLLLERIAAIRREYYHMLVRQRPKNSKYIKGWLNRVESCLNANI